jgi:hypothetical protein
MCPHCPHPTCIRTITRTVQLLVVHSSAQGSSFRCRCLSRSSRFCGHLGDPRCSQLGGRQSLHPSGHLRSDRHLLITPVHCGLGGLGRYPSVHLALGPRIRLTLRPRVLLVLRPANATLQRWSSRRRSGKSGSKNGWPWCWIGMGRTQKR